MSSKLVVFDKPKMDADCAVSGLKFVSVPKMSFKVEVAFDSKIFSKIKGDAILAEDMSDAAQKAYKVICDGISKKMKIFDKLFEGMDEKGVEKSQIDKQLAGLNGALEQDRSVGEALVAEEVKKVWTGYIARNKEYTKYKIKIGVTIFGAAAGLITSIALMATSPFTGGASAALSIIGMFKSAVTLVKEIGSAWMEIETAQAMLQKQLAFVEAAAKDVAKRNANAITASVLNGFIGVAQPSLNGCDSALGTIKQKLTGIEIKAHEASKLLNKILDEQDRLRTEFIKEATSKLSKQASPARAREQLKLIEERLEDVLTPSTTEVADQIALVMQLHKHFRDARVVTDTLSKRVSALKDALPKKEELLIKFVDNVLMVAAVPLGALSGNGISKAATDLASGLGSAGGGLVYDRITSKVLGGTLLA